jgi:Fic family protein
VDKLFTGFKGNLTAEKWEKITKCSRPTTVRDISDLIEKGVLIQNEAGGCSMSYRLAATPAGEK